MNLLDEELKALIKQYSLTNDELYRFDNKKLLISARGIRKIITAEKLNVSKRVQFDPNGGVVVTARVERNSAFNEGYSFYEALGEAKQGLNTSFNYPVSVAEARANGRAVLMYMGLYEKGVIAEAELDLETQGEAIYAKRKEQVDTAMASLTEKLKGKKK